MKSHFYFVSSGELGVCVCVVGGGGGGQGVNSPLMHVAFKHINMS